MMMCPNCGALLETYVTYCAGEPIVVYYCRHCRYSSAEVAIVYSNNTNSFPPYNYKTR